MNRHLQQMGRLRIAISWQNGRSVQAMVLYPRQDITLDQHTVPYLVGKIPPSLGSYWVAIAHGLFLERGVSTL